MGISHTDGDTLGDVFPLSLELSVGELSDGALGLKRKGVLTSLMAEFPPPSELADKMLEQARQNFDAVMDRAKDGEELRIWYSSLPDD